MNEQETKSLDAAAADTHDAGRKTKRTLQGNVVSDKNDKTIVVAVTRQLKHPLYGKFIKKTKKFHCHDEANEAGLGDEVRVVECRPMSRLKRWRLVEIVKKAV